MDSVSHCLCQLVFLGDGGSLPLEAARWKESPGTRLPVPGFLRPVPLTWGAAGAAGLMLGFVVFLFLVPAGLVLRVVWGQLQGEIDLGEELLRGQLGRAERPEKELPLSKPAPTHLRGPSLTSRGWDAVRRLQRPRTSGPQARPPGEAHSGRMAASPAGWRPGGKVRGLALGAVVTAASGARGRDRTQAEVPRGARAAGLAWPPGLQRQAQEVGVELAGHGAGTGSAGS